MKHRLLAACAGVLVLACLAPGFASAGAAVVDQKNETSDTILAGTVGAFAQTFQVGKTGSMTGVALWMYAPSGTVNVSVNIDSLTAGHPSGTHLSSGSTSFGTTDAFVFIPMTPFAVTAGQHLAIVFTLSAATVCHVSYTVDRYPNGAALNGQLGPWDPLQDAATEDFNFRTYVVLPAATAPPTSTAPGSSPDGGAGVPLFLPMGLLASLTLIVLVTRRRRQRLS